MVLAHPHPDAEIATVLAHFHRVLRPGGSLLLSFHVGDEPKLKTEGYGGHPMKVYVHRLGGILLARRHPQRSAPGHGQAKGY
ncbi:class I SAM-dependent methyltransferase [Streptomyces sp. Je 1-369]|uniref:class I SAM-dependent methyltransferase n=1 Tax=Streptomyces sp. Je 1-369 TaxID=2966192 RepID=UPI00228601B9|nr:class I SAM-dependent methyltransferase [Streptomyces sp. Je 1-369]WAL99535.1 class I SAM-dependent methyltransferase [Streptomyces sp. Je 1-369]